MKNYILILFIGLLSISVHAQTCNDLVYNGVFPVSVEPVTIICHKRYVVGYSKVRKTPLWTSEKLTEDNIKNQNVKRRDHFRSDPNVASSLQASNATFVGTDYDKGHLAPFDDFADDIVAADESFFLTNIVPQPLNNNRGIWKSLEHRTQILTLNKKTTFIITGPIFTSQPEKKMSDGTLIPDKLFKVIVSPTTKEVYTVVIPNVSGLKVSTLSGYYNTFSSLRTQLPKLNLIPQSSMLVDKKLN